MKSYKPDAKSLTALQIMIPAVALLIIVLIGIFIHIYILVVILSVLLALTALIASFVYLPMYFSHLSYNANENEIKKTSGVFFKTSQSIKYSSIQYSTFVSTPFSRVTGLNFIIFYVYGGKLILLFLKKSDAEEILKNSGCLYCGEE